MGHRTTKNDVEKVLKEYKRSAKKRKLPFFLTFRDVAVLIRSPCCFCGYEPLDDERNGIDRIDSSLGYVHGNVSPCCSNCNFCKGSMSDREFLDLVNRIHYYSGVHQDSLDLD